MYLGPEPPEPTSHPVASEASWKAGWKSGWERGTLDEANARHLYSHKLSEIEGCITAFDAMVRDGRCTEEHAVDAIGRIFYPNLRSRLFNRLFLVRRHLRG